MKTPQWPAGPVGILIMGKRQGTKKENRQLWGRAALAAALWFSYPGPKPYLIFVASDVHGPQLTPDAHVVKSILLNQFEIPADYLILRQHSNCTLLEVRAARIISRAYDLPEIFAITHLYHAPRAQRYFDEIMAHAAVIPVHTAIMDEISLQERYRRHLPQLKAMVENSLPSTIDAAREHVIEWALTQAHRLDRRGRFERRLAHLLRPGAYKKK